MINWTDEFIHSPAIFIADATNALACFTASSGDSPLAKLAVVAAANVQPAP